MMNNGKILNKFALLSLFLVLVHFTDGVAGYAAAPLGQCAERIKEEANSIVLAFQDPRLTESALEQLLQKHSKESLAKALASRVNVQNQMDVRQPLLEGIRRSELEGEELKAALYRATRLSRTHDILNFIGELSMGEEMATTIVLSEQNLSYLEYFGVKADASNFRFAKPQQLQKLLRHVEDEEMVTLVVGAQLFWRLMENPPVAESIRNSNAKVLINDQFESSITPFNFKNPEAIARALRHPRDQWAVADKERLKNLRLSHRVRLAEFDPQIKSSSPLQFQNPPRRLIDVDGAIQRLEPIRLTTEIILENLEDRRDPGHSLPLALASMTMESLQLLNERVGRLYGEAKAYAVSHGYDREPYFYVESTEHSSVIVQQILMESYGVPEERFAVGDQKLQIEPSHQQLLPMVLVVDDFIGTGNSMLDFLDLAPQSFVSTNGNTPAFFVFAPLISEKANRRFEAMNLNRFVGVVLQNPLEGVIAQHFSQKGLLNSTLGHRQSSTAVSFEYMSPDNNAGLFRPYCDCWSYPGTVK